MYITISIYLYTPWTDYDCSGDNAVSLTTKTNGVAYHLIKNE